jgi:hypothetical protein
VNLNLGIMENKTTDRHFSNFFIAGFTYWEGCMAIADLKVGSQLQLVRERENRFDPHAVAIYFNEHKLGFIPRDENELIAKFLDLGYSEMFDLRVQRIALDAHPEKQVGAVVFINEANKVYNN